MQNHMIYERCKRSVYKTMSNLLNLNYVNCNIMLLYFAGAKVMSTPNEEL